MLDVDPVGRAGVSIQVAEQALSESTNLGPSDKFSGGLPSAPSGL